MEGNIFEMDSIFFLIEKILLDGERRIQQLEDKIS